MSVDISNSITALLSHDISYDMSNAMSAVMSQETSNFKIGYSF